MKLKHAQSQLESLRGFREPDVMLEQYPTGPDIAARMLFTIHTTFNEIENKAIGAALFGAAYNIGFDIDSTALEVMRENLEELELTRHVDLVHCDVVALLQKEAPIKVELAGIQVKEDEKRVKVGGVDGSGDGDGEGSDESSDNEDEAEDEEDDAEEDERRRKKLKEKPPRSKRGGRGGGGRGRNKGFMAQGRGRGGGRGRGKGRQQDVIEVELDEEDDENVDWGLRWGLAPVALLDTVITNPPFGTRRKGIDMVFVQVGLQLARTSVYSLHKTSTREHILRKAAQWGVDAKVVATLKYDIPRMYEFHTHDSKDIEVDFIRFAHRVR